MNTYTIGEAGTTDSDCHFSLFGQGRSPPRTRLRPSNKRRNFNEGQEIQRIGFCRQHLQVRWQSSGRKGHSVWLTARAGDVRRERHAGHADCKRRGLQRRNVHRHRYGASHPGGHACCRYRHAYPALSHLAHRLETSRRDGPELYVFVCDDDACGQRLRPYDRLGHCRRLHRGPSGPDGKILAAFCEPDRLGVRRDDHRLQPAFYRHLVLRELFRVSHRRVAEPSCRGHYTGGLSHLQFSCQGLLEAALRALRPDRGLYRLAVFRHGRLCVHEEYRSGARHYSPSQALCLYAEV